MSIRGLDGSNFYTATIDVTPGTGRTTIIAAGRIPVFASMNSFNPAFGIDSDGAGTAPLLCSYGDNGPNLGVINDDTGATAGVSLAGLENTWFGMSVSAEGPHDLSYQTLRTGLNALTNSNTRPTSSTSVHFLRAKLGTTGLGGNWNGDLVNVGIFQGLSDADEDQLRTWATVYWFDTLAAPYSTALAWGRRLSTNLTTGFGSGNPVVTGSPTNNATGDPSIAVFSAPAVVVPNLIVSVSY